MTPEYAAFLERKRQNESGHGFQALWMPGWLQDFQQHLTEWNLKAGRSALLADCGLGKGQPAAARVLTPSGWTAIGTLRVGDRVIASDGKPYEVTGVYPKAEQDTFRIHFSDGASLVVDRDHLHICRTNNDRQRGRPWRVISTEELLNAGNLRYGEGGKSRNYDVPVVSDVEFDPVSLPIEPYVLGVLLGDGHLKGNVSISTADSQLVEDVRLRLPAGVRIVQKGGSKYDYKLMTGPTGTRRHPFRQALITLGLFRRMSVDKFVPEVYQRASPADRLELLRGLMDTDGYIDPDGCCQFYSASEALADGVTSLVRSLGGVPTRSSKQTACAGKPGHPCHVVTFSLKTHNPFRLRRKADRWNPAPRDNGRWIDRIEFERRQRTVCISVDSPDSSYVTEHFIVTHNTPMQLVWAENVVRKTNRHVLILTPLAVAQQTVREGAKFDIDCRRSPGGEFAAGPHIVVANYDRLHLFNPLDIAGVVCDESSAIKAFNGRLRAQVTEFLRRVPYRLLATATAAPNDYTELGTASEALGVLGLTDMLTRFFVNDQNNVSTRRAWAAHGGGAPKWRFKGHASGPFWKWVCSWARACRKPSDLGFSDEGYVLPPLTERDHVVGARSLPEGVLFPVPAVGMREEREERRRTLRERCETAASLVDHDRSAVVWCDLNPEGDLLERIIPDARQVKGATPHEEKEEIFEAFSAGQLRILVLKPKLGAWGLNWQHCSHVVTFPNHSYEQDYQKVRRCWRYGQTREVVVDRVLTEGEVSIRANLQRKSLAADRMFTELVAHMNEAARLDQTNLYRLPVEVPAWL